MNETPRDSIIDGLRRSVQAARQTYDFDEATFQAAIKHPKIAQVVALLENGDRWESHRGIALALLQFAQDIYRDAKPIRIQLDAEARERVFQTQRAKEEV